jgi:predicted ATPase
VCQVPQRLTTTLTCLFVELLKELNPTDSMLYSGEREGCLSSTGEEILDNITKWAINPEAPGCFILVGPVGTGKTAIAQTAYQRLSFSKLGAISCFISNDSGTHSSLLRRVVHSTIYQLGFHGAAIRSYVCSVIRDSPDILRESIDEQIRALLLGPMNALGD